MEVSIQLKKDSKKVKMLIVIGRVGIQFNHLRNFACKLFLFKH